MVNRGIFRTKTRLFVFAVILLILLSTVLFHALEDWTWIQSFYFAVSTLTTVGFGDLVPTNETSRLATALFMLFGIGAFVTLLSVVESSMADKRDRIGKKINGKLSKES